MSPRTDRRGRRAPRPDAAADDGRRATRRAELLDAAKRVIRREGAGASMEDIAREAGITKPILYRVFGSRDGLVHAVAEEFVDDIGRALDDVLDGDDPRQVLRSGIGAYLAVVEAEPELTRFVTERLSGSGEQHVMEFIDQVARKVAVVLGDRLGQAGIDSGGAEVWAYGLVGMAFLSGQWWSERRTMSRERVVDYLVQLVWEGLEGQVAPASEGPPGATR